MEIEYVEIIAFVLSAISTLAIIIPYILQLDSSQENNIIKAIKLENISSSDPKKIDCKNDEMRKKIINHSNNTNYAISLCNSIKDILSGNIDDAIKEINKNISSLESEKEEEEFKEKYYYLIRNLNFNYTLEKKILSNNPLGVKIDIENVIDDSKNQRNFAKDSCIFGKSCTHKNYSDIHNYIKNLETKGFDLYFKTNENYAHLFSLREAHNKFINDFSLFIIVSFISGPLIFILVTRLYNLKDDKSNKDKVSEVV